MARYLYSELASTLDALKRCRETPDNPWIDKHGDYLDALVNLLPSGSGIDNGTRLDNEASHAEKLVFTFGFHHMNDGGYYDGWSDHVLTVTPSFCGINLRISGRNRDEIKDYLHDTYYQALTRDVTLTWYQHHFGDLIPAITHKWIDGCTQVCSVILPDGERSGSYSMVHDSLVKWCEENQQTLRDQLNRKEVA